MGTTVGAIIMAMLAKEPRSGPAFGKNCDILEDGMVVTPVRRNGKWGAPERLGTTIDVRNNLRTLCDHCKLNDADRLALFIEFGKWIRKDHRVRSEV